VQTSPSEQKGCPPWQKDGPPGIVVLQVSPVVQRLPSSHATPGVAIPRQILDPIPASMQRSFTEQTLLSLQVVPSGNGAYWQASVCGSQRSSVQELPSLQTK
jgi:hypothetical protein